MDVHNSPMEAVVAFNPVNLGPLLTAAVNNLWAWLALLTSAAFNFCRARPTTTSLDLKMAPSSDSITTASFGNSKEKEGTPRATPSDDSTATTSLSGSNKKEEEGVLTRGNSSKELFTVCFKEERENEGQSGYFDHQEAEVVKRWRVEMRRRGDLGWYGYQDMSVIDGSVVRLWEEEREKCSPRSYRRRCSSVGITPIY